MLLLLRLSTTLLTAATYPAVAAAFAPVNPTTMRSGGIAAAERGTRPPPAAASALRDVNLQAEAGAGAGAGDQQADDDEVDPWVLRAVTFENLDAAMEPRLLSEFLMELGASSTSITDHDAGTELERPVFGEPGEDDDEGWPAATTESAAVICGDAAVGRNVWRRCDVTAHLPATFSVPDVAESIRVAFDLPTAPRYRVDDVPDRDWVKHVQSSWKPVVCSGFVLRFPWHTQEDVAEAIAAASEEEGAAETAGEEVPEGGKYAELQLEGGIAFGTGEHPTTQLCLGWIHDVVGSGNHDDKANDNANNNANGNAKNNAKNKMRILDYGAGSGVLGLAACALSSDVTAVGIEIDADAVRIANANANANGLNMTSYLPPERLLLGGGSGGGGGDSESASVFMRGAMRARDDDQMGVNVLPPGLDGPYYDACAANILAGPLIGLAPTISSLVRPGGRIGLSGILADQADRVVEAYSEYFTDVRVAKERGGWVLVTGIRGVACPIEVG